MTEIPARKVRKRTGAQITAAQPDTSVWVSANAGTGKTGVLVDRISRLLLQGVEPERILCLTFTKAAAAEMANRLAALLSSWSAMSNDDMGAELIALGETDITEDKIIQARRLFALTLEAPEGLRIRTIHSFCESLLGRFPLEAQVAPDFRVMDERGQRELQHEARDHLLQQSEGRGSDLSVALYDLAGLVDESRFADLMKELDTQRGKFARALQRYGSKDGLIAAVYKTMQVDLTDTPDKVKTAASDLSDVDLASVRRVTAAWAEGSATNKNAAALINTWLTHPPEVRAQTWRKDFAAAFLTGKDEPRSDKSLMSKGALAADAGALDDAYVLANLCARTLDKLKALNAAMATRALIHVGGALIQSYEEIKKRQGKLDYDDLIARAAQLLNSPAGVSWVHYKLDGGIEHVLVDEAQDTSPDQWHVIDQVASDFYSGESRYEEVADRPRTVFAVGDEKQSIYSFQGAEPAMFSAMRDQFAARVQSVEQTWRPVEMADCFRSTPAVLSFVDTVFENPDAAEGLSFETHGIRHISARQGQAGMVELWPYEEPDDQDGAEDPWDVPVNRVPTESPEDRVATRIADTISDWIDNGEYLAAQNRNVEAGDILILVQKRRRFAELMVAKLKERGIPVAGRDRMVLTDQLAIQDLLALGRVMLLPEDDLNTATVLKGPLIGLTENQLFDLAYERTGTVFDALVDAAKTNTDYASALSRLNDWRQHADFSAPFEFFSNVLNADGGRRALLRDLGPDANEPIDDFLSAAIDFERDHTPSLEGFLHWMATGATEVKRDLEQGRRDVRVMTVHGAKGLQSEIVILADACSVPSNQSDGNIRWLEDDTLPIWPAFSDNETEDLKNLKEARRKATLEEYHRLLYVALTRAMDRLYICGFTGKRGPSETSWYDFAATAMASLGAPTIEADGRKRWTFSESQIALPDGTQTDSDEVIAHAPLPDWTKTAPEDEPDPPRPLSPSRPDDEAPPALSPLGANYADRFKRGRAVHALLQTLPDLADAQWDEAIRRYLAQPLHGFSVEQQTEMANEILALLNDPMIAPVFGAESQAEVPIIGKVIMNGKTRVISGQIDRLVRTKEGVLLIDYKTNRPPPDVAEDVAPVYLRQMATYRTVLQDVFPNIPIRAILLWTDGPRWMELPEHLMEIHAP